MGEEDLALAAAISDCFHLLRQAKEEGSIHQLPSDQFKKVISCCQKLASTTHSLVPPLMTDLADIFLETLAECSLSFDNQILASSAFCLILQLIQEPLNISLLFSKNFITAGNEPFQVKLSKNSEITVLVRKPDLFKLCVCNGLLQLGEIFWSSQHLNWNALMFSKMFPLLERTCFSYTHLTFLSFKALKLWLVKVNSAVKQSRKLLPDILMKIARIVMSNWENQINGIREQNIYLFEQFLVATESLGQDLAPEYRYLNQQSLMDVIMTEQSWMMKSKYLMLSVLIPKIGLRKVLDSNIRPDLIAGLLHSLCCAQLVSAGTDLYKVSLEEMSLEMWQQQVLPPLISILSSPKQKQELQKQNIFNYWMPPTIKKFKLSLQLIMDSLMELDGCSDKDITLSVICCLKLGRKDGYESMQWQTLRSISYLPIALKHSDEHVRSQAFSAVCVSSKSSLMPSEEEFELVKAFLEENINMDLPALRHSMVASLTSFLCRMRDGCALILTSPNMKDAMKEENVFLKTSVDFLDWLYTFLHNNLEIGSNYQRKFTSLEIYKIVLSYFTEESVPTMVLRRTSLKEDRIELMKYASKLDKWRFTDEKSREVLLYCISDPSADIREAAATLMMAYFKIKDDKDMARFDELFKSSLSLCSNSMFYCAESGVILIRVIATMRAKSDLATTDRVSSSILLMMAQNQVATLKEDILKAASSGAPLHGVLRALERLVIDKDSPEHNKLTEAERLKLITLLESTVAYLLQVLASKTSGLTEFAPSFCEMGEAIESVIKESSITIEDEEMSSSCNLSPAYQLVLNCIWLNLKACCSLASGLVASYGCTGLGTAEAWRCAEIPLSVLKQCRHKGALEAAGNSLAITVRTLSSAGLIADIARVLSDSLTALEERSSITQSTRGAGFVIMVHRAVAADSRPNKPLVSTIVSRLISAVECNRGDVCQALQLLAALVQDSSLTQEMASYYHRLTLLSFRAIASSDYPVRNGGLHLFGAVIPKVVGQRRRYDTSSNDSSASSSGGQQQQQIAFEEIHYHCGELLEWAANELQQAGSVQTPNDTAESARIVAALTLVSYLTAGPLISIDRSQVDNSRTIHERLVDGTRALLSSNSVKIRRLASRANAWLYLPSHLSAQIHNRMWPASLFLTDRTLHTEITSENQLHGYLLNIKHLMERMNQDKVGNSSVSNQLKHVNFKTIDQLATARFDKISFTCRAVLSEISNYDETKPANRQIEDVIGTTTQSDLIRRPHLAIGMYVWTSKEIMKIINNCPLDKLVPCLYTCLINCENHELHKACISSLLPRVKNPKFRDHSNGIINILNHYVSIQVKDIECGQVLEIILEILTRYKDDLGELSTDNLIEALTGDVSHYKVRLASVRVAVLGALLSLINWNANVALEMSWLVVALSDPADNDEDTRFDAARALRLVAGVIKNWDYPDSGQVKTNLWESAVRLLQDENPRVRSEASYFASILAERPMSESWNSYVSLKYLFSHTTISNLLPLKEGVHCLWSYLKCTSSELLRLDIAANQTILNPYEIGITNIYAEHNKVIDMAFDSLSAIVGDHSDIVRTLPTHEIIPHLKLLKENCQKISKFYGDHLLCTDVMLFDVWYMITKKVSYMYRIINHVNNLGDQKELDMFEFRYYSYLEQME